MTTALVAACVVGCAVGTQDFTRVTGDVSPGDDDDASVDSGPHITKLDGSTDANVSHDTGGAGKDAGGPDTNPPPVDSSLPDTNLPDTNPPPIDTGVDTGNSSTCQGLTEWFAGITDAKVKHNGEEYTCKVAGWCSESDTNAVAAYEPGKGWAWTDAWDDSGPCP